METVIIRFHAVCEKLSAALDGLDFDELGVSDEVKEQVFYCFYYYYYSFKKY